MNCLTLKKSNCMNCYKCIRHCPVKAIRFSGGQAHIINNECILCGNCFVVCPQNAKEITDEPDKEFAYVFEFVDTLMESPLGERVIGMELGDRFDLWFVMEGRIRVRVGTMDELERKLTLAERSLQDRVENGGVSDVYPTMVDVSDPTRIIHSSSPKVEMPDWAY